MTGIAPVPVSSRVARGRRATGADVSRRSCNDAGDNHHLVLARARRMVRGSDDLLTACHFVKWERSPKTIGFGPQSKPGGVGEVYGNPKLLKSQGRF